MRNLLSMAASMLVLIGTPAFAQTTDAPSEPCVETRRERCPTAAELLGRANERARRTPLVGGFNEARQVHDYAPGAIYELNAATNRVSTLLLEPGETITAIAAGDTTRWMVTEAATELETLTRAVVLVKPLAANVETNIVIVTDRRTYLIEARAGAGRTYAAELSWSYSSAAPVEPSQNMAEFADYRVRVVRGRRPVWTPVAVRDNGSRTIIEFAPNVTASDMPPLFVLTGEGAELVNYRVDGTRYIVDRVFDRAELRLGVRAPVVVRIERGSHHPTPRRRSGP